MTYQPKRVLITGSAGFIGANLVHYLLASDPLVRLVSLDLLTYAGNRTYLEKLPDATRHTFIHGDICDGVLVARLLRELRVDGDVTAEEGLEFHADLPNDRAGADSNAAHDAEALDDSVPCKLQPRRGVRCLMLVDRTHVSLWVV